MTKLVNCTPHAIVLNDGRTFEPCGILPRVKTHFGEFDQDGIADQWHGAIEGLPERKEGVKLIVSAMVLSASGSRDDLIAPATSHPECRRNEKGHIVSVPGFVR